MIDPDKLRALDERANVQGPARAYNRAVLEGYLTASVPAILAMAEREKRMREALEPFAEAADQAERLVGHEGPLDPVVPLSACIQAQRALREEKA